MAKVACLLADDFEDSEFKTPVNALRGHGHEVVVLGESFGKTLVGKHKLEIVRVDDAIANRSPGEFDAILIPGGHSPDRLRLLTEAVAFCKEFAETGRPIAAVCHGPQLLIAADVVRGRRMTSWPSVKVDLENAGARWVDEEVVIDKPFITSRKPADLEAFSRALLESLREGASSPRL